MGRTLLGVAALFGVLLACTSERQRPPPPVCVGDCGLPSGWSIGSAPPSTPDGGAGGDGGSSDEPVTLVGDVVAVTDLLTFRGQTYFDPAEIRTRAPDGKEVVGTWNGSDFEVSGVEAGPAVWVEVRPSFGDVLPTLQPLDTRPVNGETVISTRLAVLRESALDLAFNVLALPIARDPSRAQALLFVREDGEVASGVTVTLPGAELMIYSDAGSFSDTATRTDDSGLVVAANVPAVPWPGSLVTVTLSRSGTVTGRFEINLVAGAVTVGCVGDCD